MGKKRRKFRRPTAQRECRKLFVIAVEGAKTEPQYFRILSNQTSTVKIECLKSNNDSSPKHILRRMEKFLKDEKIRPSDEAWLVTDRDQWPEEQLNELYLWSQTESNYGFALSNPKFEYWLLLHFEDGTGISSSRDCSDRLKKHLPNYGKGINRSKINHSQIKEAIHRAKQRDIPPCIDWPRALGTTTVYKLVEKILQT